jgi:hypothetical protein
VDASAEGDPGGHLICGGEFDGYSCRKLCDALSTAPWTDGQSFLGLARADKDFRLGGIGSDQHLLQSWGAIVAFAMLTVKTFALPTVAPMVYRRAFYHRRKKGNSNFLFLFFTSGCLGVCVPRGTHTWVQPSVFLCLCVVGNLTLRRTGSVGNNREVSLRAGKACITFDTTSGTDDAVLSVDAMDNSVYLVFWTESEAFCPEGERVKFVKTMANFQKHLVKAKQSQSEELVGAKNRRASRNKN